MATLPIITDDELLSGVTGPSPSPSPTRHSPVKSFLGNFLYGAGQSMLKHDGLKTDDEKDEFARRLGLQEYQAQTQRKSVEDLGAVRQQQVETAQAALAPTTVPDDFPIESLRGKQITTAAYQGLLKAVPTYQGRVEAAQTAADARRDVADTTTSSRERVAAGAQAVQQAIANRRFQMTGAGLDLRRQSLDLRRMNTEASLFGTVNGVPIPGAPEISTPVGGTQIVGLRTAPTAIKSNKTATTFNDLQGSTQHAVQALEQLYSSGGSLSDPSTVLGMQQHDSAIGKVLGGAVKSRLSDPQVQAIGALNQLREQAGIMRSMTGGTAAEAQAQRILDTIPTAGDPPALARQKMKELQVVLQRLAPASPSARGGIQVQTGRQSAASPPTSVPPGYELRDGPKGRGYYRKAQ